MANINHFDFKNYRVFETEIAGRKLTVETGKMAQLANGSCLVRYGETAVLVTATASAKPRDGIDFFPLSVDFEERMYAVGRIPGSFMRREGRPSEKAILSSRQIDRPMRPLFPKGPAQRRLHRLHRSGERLRQLSGGSCSAGRFHRSFYL